MWVPPLATVGTSEWWRIVSANDDESNLTLKVFTPRVNFFLKYDADKDDDDKSNIQVFTPELFLCTQYTYICFSAIV